MISATSVPDATMARAEEELSSPSGDRLIFRKTAADTDGQLLEVEVAYAPGGEEPPDHYHPYQSERFEVLEGRIFARVDGRAATYEAGAWFDVPRGAVHAMRNGGSEVARVRWQVRPALRTEDFFEAIWTSAAKDEDASRGRPPFLQLAVILRAYDREFRLAKPTFAVQKVIFTVLAGVGKLLGYRAEPRKRRGE